jgi:hypothetical protein
MNPKFYLKIRSNLTLRYMGSASDKTSEKALSEVSESLCLVGDTISPRLAVSCVLIFIRHSCRGAMVTEPHKLPGISRNLFIVLLLSIAGGAIEPSVIATRFEIQGRCSERGVQKQSMSIPSDPSQSFQAQGQHRVDSRGSTSRDDAGYQGHCAQQNGYRRQRDRIRRLHSVE